MIFVNGMDITSAVFTTVIVYYLLALGCYFLLSYGLYRMAINRNIANPKRAFIPFYRYLIAGKVIGKSVFFGRITDKIGKITLIVRAVTVGLNLFTTIFSNYLVFCALVEGLPINVTSDAMIYIGGDSLTALQQLHYAKGLIMVGSLVSTLSTIATFAWLVIAFSFWSGLFNKFKPGMSFMYTFIAVVIALITESFLLPLEIGGLFVFIFRNRPDIKVNVVYRNPYNPYGQNGGYDNYGGSYNSDPYGRTTPVEPQNTDGDPFEEFSSDKKNDDPFGF